MAVPGAILRSRRRPVVRRAVTDRAAAQHGISAFVLEKGTPGFRPGKKENKLGLRASATGEVIFENCRVPPAQVEEVIMGNVLQAGLGQNPARQAALKAGLPDTVAAVTVNKVCGSGLKAVMLAAQAVRAGDAELLVAGGMENMSRAPYLLPGARAGWKFGDQQVVDEMIRDGLWCAFEYWHMGSAAEHIAAKCGISRQD